MKTNHSLCVLLIGGLAITAGADWNTGQSSKWVQLPDESPMGLDVKLFDDQAAPPLILADDFLCTQTGPITDIHMWGSWLHDMVPPPENVSFVLSLYSDVPAGPGPGEYSHPGNLLWQKEVAHPSYTARPWSTVTPGEGWYDPIAGIYEPNADTIIWQYNFYFGETNSFIQKGSPEQPVVYWLSVQALVGVIPGDSRAIGWKSSMTNWNDDAVWASQPGDWNELRYPAGHPREGQSMDLAFVITTTNVAEEEFDFGDAPEGALAYPGTGVLGSFPTCKNVPAATWIHHGLGWAHFGQGWDAEPDGNAGACPLFNPNSYNQDECIADGDAGLIVPGAFTITGPLGTETVVPCIAGVTPKPLGSSCQTANWGTDIDIQVINNMPVAGYVNVLMDWNQDGAWSGGSACSSGLTAPEHVLTNFPVPVGFSGPLSTLLPPGFLIGPSNGCVWSRFTITERQIPQPWTGDGQYEDGETEDYLLLVQDPLDFGDAPSPYPTLLINNGARHLAVPGIHLGANMDIEPDGQPSLNSDGDDLNTFFPGILFPPGDEDGVNLPPVLIAGRMEMIQVIASVPGYLNAWIDWNANGTWLDPGEQVYANFLLNPGLNLLPLNVPLPPMLAAGGPHSRWRFTTYMSALPQFTGQESDGEVEDYEVRLEILDFGDAPSPYPTLLAADGARHRMPSGYWLGPNPPDHEPEGQPHPQALGDDFSGLADEDGVTLAGSMVQGAHAVLNIQASTNTGYLNVWVDFNQSGSWADPGEHIVADMALLTGGNVMTSAVPSSATLGLTFGRFRFSSLKGLAPTGFAADGEVEDHAFTIYQAGPTGTLVITHAFYTDVTDDMTIQWPGEGGVTYGTEYTAMDLANTNRIWNAWGAYVTTAPYQQVDTNPAETMKFYRVFAPYAPPPP